MKTKFFESTQLMPGVTAIAGLGGEYALSGGRASACFAD